MKKLTSFLLALLILSASCNMQHIEAEPDYQAVDNYLIKVHNLMEQTYQLKKNNAEFEQNMVELESLSSIREYEGAMTILEGRFNIRQSELDELMRIGNTLFVSSKMSSEDFENFINKRYNHLFEAGVVNIPIGEGESLFRRPCWLIFGLGVVTAASALALGCATGVGCIAAGIYAGATIVNATYELCEECGCN